MTKPPLLLSLILLSIVPYIYSKPTAQPYRWNSVKIIAGGFVDGILFHPNAKDVLYARTDIGGAYRWDPATSLWMPLNDALSLESYNNMGIEGLAIDPTDPSRLYAAVGMYTASWASNGAILRSSDQGRTWATSNLPIKLGGNEDGRFAGERLSVDPNYNNTLFFGSRNDGLWKSEDGAVGWAKVGSFPITGQTNGIGVIFVLYDTSSGHVGMPTPIIYVGASQKSGIYRSTDAGKTWAILNGQPTSYIPNRAVLTKDGIMYVTYGDVPGPNGMAAGAVYRYNTKTDMWTNISPFPGVSGYGFAGLSVDGQRSNVLMVATMDRWSIGDTILRSLDSGSSWHDIGPQSSRDSSLSPWVTFGASTASLGWWIGALAIDPFRPGHVLYGTGATIWASMNVDDSDSGRPTQWAVGANGIEETAVLDLISPPSGAPLLSGVGDIGGFRHDDLNRSPPQGMWTNPKLSNIDALDFVQSSPQTILRVGRGDTHLGAVSHDGGNTWTPFNTNPPGDDTMNSIAASPDGSTYVWTHGMAAPHWSKNGGTSWTQSAGTPNGLRVISDRVNSKSFYGFDTTSGTVYVSSDGAANFSATVRGLPTGAYQLRAVPGYAGELWLAAGNAWDSAAGLFRSTDGGAHFTKVTTTAFVRTVGFGKAAPGKNYPAVFIQGVVGGVDAIYRSDDSGSTWVQINDQQHQYGGATTLTGDPRTYGRVYIGTNGRGILYGDIA